jgi:hypothetical protein
MAIGMKKFGRNEPCPCGSGKKFKKCCEETLIKGRFRADKAESMKAPQLATASRLAGLFKTQVANSVFPTGGEKPIRATSALASPVEETNPAPQSESKVSSEEPLEQKGDI